jgi:ABC-2 type transport system permease protein
VKNIKSVKQRFRYASILLRQLVRTDFKLRYQGSALGYLWSLLKPLFLFGILYVVFVKIVGVDYGVDHDGVYLLFGIVLWSFFSEFTGASVTAVVEKGDLLRKLNFPKYVVIFSTAFSALINLVLSLVIVTAFMLFEGVDVGLRILYVLPLFAELFVFSLGLGFFLSTVYVKLRDMGHIWDVIMQALFYLTPILYPLSFASPWVQKILIMNPVAQILQDMRYVLVSTKTTTITDVYGGNSYVRLVPVGAALFSFVVFAYYFKSKSKNFAEEI